MGVAIFGRPEGSNLVLRIKLGEQGNFEKKGAAVLEQVRKRLPVKAHQLISEYLRLVVGPVNDIRGLVEEVEGVAAELGVVSLGTRLEIVKQVGSPENLERQHQIRSFSGTHGIGHTRLSTESRVDLSHSQPFWAHGVPDLASVHNGHITNYHKMRRRYDNAASAFTQKTILKSSASTCGISWNGVPPWKRPSGLQWRTSMAPFPTWPPAVTLWPM